MAEEGVGGADAMEDGAARSGGLLRLVVVVVVVEVLGIGFFRKDRIWVDAEMFDVFKGGASENGGRRKAFEVV